MNAIATRWLSVAGVALVPVLFAYREEAHWQCGMCWSQTSTTRVGVGVFDACLPFWTSETVRESASSRLGFAAPHVHVRIPGHGAGHRSGGVLVGRYVACGTAMESEFAMRIEREPAFAAWLAARVASGEFSRDEIARVVAVPFRRREPWERDEANRAVLRRGCEIAGAFDGVPARESKLWWLQRHDPFAPLPPPPAPGH